VDGSGGKSVGVGIGFKRETPKWKISPVAGVDEGRTGISVGAATNMLKPGPHRTPTPKKKPPKPAFLSRVE